MTTLEEIIEAEFFATLEALAIRPRGDFRPQMDGRLHRFSTEDDRGGEKSGAYFVHADGLPNWGVMDFRQHGEMQKFKLDRDRLPEGSGTHDKQAINTRKEQEEHEAEQARARAYDEYSRANQEAANFHPYCRLKKVDGVSSKLRVVVARINTDFCDVGDLLIPIVNATTRRFQSLQRISRRTTREGKHIKGIYSKTRLAGGCFEFIPKESPQKIIVCEGFATGASIFKVARVPSVVLSAMSCNNLANVARVWRKRLRVPLIIAADNDKAGLTAARDVLAAGFADGILTPPVAGWDWNDYINSR